MAVLRGRAVLWTVGLLALAAQLLSELIHHWRQQCP